MRISKPWAIGLAAVALVGAGVLQRLTLRNVGPEVLRSYAGTYRWEDGPFVTLGMWAEPSGSPQLVAFDDSGEVRTLYPSGGDRFFAGPGIATSAPVESRVAIERDATGAIAGLTWRRDREPPRKARRTSVETSEEIRFRNGDVSLAGTFLAPAEGGPHPAIVLVHGSGAADRTQVLPFARFLVRHGVALLAYDKRGVGGSTGDWQVAGFDDLAGDVLAAVDYLRSRADVDATQVGLLGVSQAGWVMPLAAVRQPDLAFLISVSGPALPPAETTIDHARNEMTAGGMRPELVDQIAALMQLQYRYARTGEGWDEYRSARAALVARLGAPSGAFPGDAQDPHWHSIRRIYFHDPVPVLRRLTTPTLALFGELDNNVVPGRHQPVWQAALQAAGNRDYTVAVLPAANHMLLEARTGSNAEMPSLRRIVPAYRSTVRKWLETRVRGFR